jgi:uncharacterized protein (DUF58 family)
VTGVVLAGALASGVFVVLVWAVAMVLAAVAGVWWSRVAWRGVRVRSEVQPAKAFAGEDVTLRIEIRNAKRTPLPIVRVALALPDGLSEGPSVGHEPGPLAFSGHRRRLSMEGDSEVTVSLAVRTERRGEFWLEPIEIELCDPFDLVPVRRRISLERPIVVMPEPANGVPLRVRRVLPFGAPAPAARLFEDRERFAGVRDYEPGDPMHHVHWRLSAHVGHLQTMMFDPTRSAEVLFALDVARGEPFWRSVDTELAEETIGWASYAARQAIAAGWRVGLVANTHLKRGRGALRIPPATSAASEAALFTALARMPNQPTNDLAPVLREVGRRMVRRTTVLVLSADPGPSLFHEIAVLRRRGADVVHVAPEIPP